ncbi:3'(2'),5'-bisphosphate nucleotidase CysQ [Marinobacter sp. X15-166B]|uniref:3'(2'),5'-bisphosphate nucleotidase CysQ n=1 Tax=Marinobacter sp. X15-166B TaxID=1897620 RepID=UPI00085BD984|nr:3'(2'),5'-bisphosphate nucleotidase CysQ [Marinobacter sp. X15-166B]OEY67854.1 3'(2'),5'-bisphosphate nucleotidase [Marinobacter sp. X15-166B]
MHYPDLLPDVLNIADAAGVKVMEIYNSDFKVAYKADNSPVTAADLAAHTVILAGLQSLTPDIPVLSEEAATAPWSQRRRWFRFWLVDPIDGTKEFTQRSGEFTVNIALIEHGRPVLGVVTAPALQQAYWGAAGEGAWKRDGEPGQQRVRRIHVVVPSPTARVLASKNHLDDATRAYIGTLGPQRLVQAGSSLKFCRIAEGSADLYPRLGPTSEWDTGAGHAVLAAAGGRVITFSGGPLRYGKPDVLNPHFIAAGK